MAKHQITHSLCLPSLAQTFLPNLPEKAIARLDTLIVAGEAMPASLMQTAASHAPKLMLVNEYGPTESTVWATASQIRNLDGASVSIGTPVPGTETSICDRDGSPLHIGFEGELMIAGPMLADGYLHQPGLTAERFKSRLGGAQERLYRTGDLGYQGVDGQFYLLGRADDQVKIRGYRVELGEIERIAQDIFNDALCVAFLADGALAIAVEREGAHASSEAFANRLSAPLVPRHIIAERELPRLPNGKIDRKALPALITAAETVSDAALPEGELEQQIARIFAEVLSHDSVPRDGNFFDLGGDSLATIAVYSKARQIGLDFAPNDIFEAQEVSALARRILSRSTNPVDHDSTRKLIHTNASADGTAVLLVHGTTALFNAVSRGLSDGQATGLAFSGYALGAETNLEHSVEDYAADVIKDLRTLKPEGPYVLCAYSAGAVIALEAARRLGDEIERIVLINPAYQVLAADEGRIASAVGKKAQADTKRYLRSRRMRHAMRVAALKALGLVMPKSEWRRRQLVRSAYVFALASYKLHAHEGLVDVIVTTGNPAMEEGGTWDSILSQKTVEELPLTHRDGMDDALKAVSPDLVLADCEHHSAVLQALGGGHRAATLSFMYFTPLGPSAPPLTHSTVPGKGVFGSEFAVAVAQKTFKAAKRVSALGAALKGRGAELASAHRALASNLGLDMSEIARTDELQVPWTYTLPNLLLVPSELDLPTSAAEHQRFVGPMILRDRARSAEEPTSSYFSSAPGRRIFAAFGSMRHPPMGFLKALIEAVETHAEWHLIIATSHPDLKALGDLPARVTCTDWVPQLSALSRADCALFHGGAGTLNECVRTETPMIIYPNALDGRGNGARIEFHGVGEVGTMKESASLIAARITRVISDQRIKDRLQVIAARNSESVTKQRATEAVEALLR